MGREFDVYREMGEILVATIPGRSNVRSPHLKKKVPHLINIPSSQGNHKLFCVEKEDEGITTEMALNYNSQDFLLEHLCLLKWYESVL